MKSLRTVFIFTIIYFIVFLIGCSIDNITGPKAFNYSKETSPFLMSILETSPTSVDLYFSDIMDSEVLNKSNYAIPGLSIDSVVLKENDIRTIVTLVTTDQSITTYEVTVRSNVKGNNGRPIGNRKLEFPGYDSSKRVIINEVKPIAASLDGVPLDINYDGISSKPGDAFVELYNTSDSDIPLNGYQIWVKDEYDSTFYNNYEITNDIIIKSKDYFVVFGDGDPAKFQHFFDCPVDSAIDWLISQGADGWKHMYLMNLENYDRDNPNLGAVIKLCKNGQANIIDEIAYGTYGMIQPISLYNNSFARSNYLSVARYPNGTRCAYPNSRNALAYSPGRENLYYK